MNQEKVGKFIAQCRKEKGLTQAQVAKTFGISNAAVSKWENGKSCPDASIMIELCDLTRRYFVLPLPIFGGVLVLISVADATIRAKKFLKKHFCKVGTSPESRIQRFMRAKQNAEIIM